MTKPEKPEGLNQVWGERELCAELGLRIGSTKEGVPESRDRSRQLGNWIKGGLKFVEKSGNRYFFEQDVIDYLWTKRTDKYGQ